MATRSITVRADEETARRAQELAEQEGRSVSEVAASALAFYVRLPRQAHETLQDLTTNGTSEDVNLMLREVTRAMIRAAWDASTRVLAAAIDARYGDSLQTEDEIEAEAVRLCRSVSR